MTVELVFDQANSSASDFSDDVKIILDLANRVERDLKRDWSETTTAETEENLQYSIAKRKKGVHTVQGKFYFDGTDKSGGTFQTAIDNGDFNLTDFNNDRRLIDHIIQDVDTTNNTFTVSGNQTRRVDLNSTIVVFGSTGNDGIYNPTDASYDAVNDETTITVNEDVTNATVDGTISTGIHDVKEQQAWLEEYVWQNIGAPQHILKSERYDEGIENGKKCVIENVLTPEQAGFTTANYTLTLREGRPV